MSVVYWGRVRQISYGENVAGLRTFIRPCRPVVDSWDRCSDFRKWLKRVDGGKLLIRDRITRRLEGRLG